MSEMNSKVSQSKTKSCHSNSGSCLDSSKYPSRASVNKFYHGLKSRNSSTMILTNERIQNVMTVEDWKSLKNFMQPVKNWLGQSLEPEPWFYRSRGYSDLNGYKF